jgi:hypothetical protein
MKAKRTVLALGVLVAVITLAGSPPVKAQLDPFVANHYLCYPITDLETPFDPRVVFLRDQFNAYQVNVLRPVDLCNPVSKNNGIIPEPDWHLVCYNFLLPVAPGPRRVQTQDQFGELKFQVQVPNRLCLPARKAELPVIGTGGG